MSAHNLSFLPIQWKFQLFVAEESASTRTFMNRVRAACEKAGHSGCSIELVDLKKTPEAAEMHRVTLVPMLIRLEPKPVRRLFVDFLDEEELIAGLGFEV